MVGLLATFTFLGKTPYDILSLCDDRRTPATLSSFVTKRDSRISRELFELESPNFTDTSTPTCPAFALDMTSLVASGWLQNAIKYGTKVMLKAGPAGQRVK